MSTYVPIQTIILSSTTASIEFTSIPQTYTDLVIIASAQRGVSGSGASGFQITLNDDSGSNYSSTLLYEGSPFATRLSNQTSMQFAGVAADGHKGTSFINFQNYSNTTMNKTVLVRFGNSTEARLSAVLWRSTSAITKIKFNPANGFASGSTFTLYGIGTGSPKANGGTTVRTDGTYWYHTFQSSGIFEPLENLSNVDYLVVAGGGATYFDGVTNREWSGGGGAGGYRNFTSQSLSKIVYTVTVGAGGARGSAPTKGSNSVFSNITSTGGGQGPAGNGAPGIAGGSGSGGSGNPAQSGGSGNQGGYTPVEGYSGGAGGTTFGGGGGGSGGVGAAGTSGNNAAGGIGTSNSISGSAVTYATGGNGGNANSGAFVSGAANTGNGAGYGGNGGSGIVIVRYPA